MATIEPNISALVAHIMQNPNETLSKDGDHWASLQLAALGAPAVRSILGAMSGPYPAGPHPIDVIEALGAVLCDIALINPNPLIDVLERNAVAPDPQMLFVVTALGKSGEVRAVDALTKASKHPNKTVRYGTVAALVEIEDERVVAPLIEALSDRSSNVKFVIVEAMKKRSDLRVADALKPLKRIVENKSLQKSSPGLCDYAREIIRKIEG